MYSVRCILFGSLTVSSRNIVWITVERSFNISKQNCCGYQNNLSPKLQNFVNGKKFDRVVVCLAIGVTKENMQQFDKVISPMRNSVVTY